MKQWRKKNQPQRIPPRKCVICRKFVALQLIKRYHKSIEMFINEPLSRRITVARKENSFQSNSNSFFLMPLSKFNQKQIKKWESIGNFGQLISAFGLCVLFATVLMAGSLIMPKFHVDILTYGDKHPLRSVFMTMIFTFQSIFFSTLPTNDLHFSFVFQGLDEIRGLEPVFA